MDNSKKLSSGYTPSELYEKTKKAVECLTVLAHPGRYEVVCLLENNGAMSVNQICRKLKLPQPVGSHYLGLLRRNGLVITKRKGKEVYYSTNSTRYAIIAEVIVKVAALPR